MSQNASPLTIEELLAHSGWIERVARSLVRDDSQAADVVQETWLAALRSPPVERGRERSWLYSVMANAVRTRSRREKARDTRERAAAQRDRSADTTELVARADSQRLVIEHVLALDEPYRTTILLRYFDDLSPDEIAARQEVPLETVRTRLRRALERVRARMRERAGEEWALALAPLLRAPEGPASVPAAVRPGRWVPVAAALLVAAAVPTVWLLTAGRDAGAGGTAETAAAAAEANAGRDGRRTERAVPPPSPQTSSDPGTSAAGAPASAGVSGPADDAATVPFRARLSGADAAPLGAGLRFRFRPLPGPEDGAADVFLASAIDGHVAGRLPRAGADGSPIVAFDVSLEAPDFLPWRTRIDAPDSAGGQSPEPFGPLTRAAVLTGAVRTNDGSALVAGVAAVASETSSGSAPFDVSDVAADGSFRLRVRPRTPHRVVVAARGFLPRVIEAPAADVGEHALAPVELAPGAAVRGRVVDATGTPLAGIRVRLRSKYLATAVRTSGHDLTLAPDRIRRFWEEGVTGADGRFAVSGLDSVEHEMTVDSYRVSPALTAGFPRTVMPDGPEMLLTVQAAFLRGTVSRDGVPVPNVWVRVGRASVETDERGQAELLVPPDTDVDLEVASGTAITSQKARTPAVGASLAVELVPPAPPPRARWRGRLAGALGASAEWCGVRFLPADGSAVRAGPFDRRVEHGEIVVENLPTGRGRVVVRPGTTWLDSRNRNSEFAADVDLVPGEETVTEISTSRAGRLSVLARNPEGRRVLALCVLRDASGAQVQFQSQLADAPFGGGHSNNSIPAEGPTSVFPTLAPGRYVLELKAAKLADTRVEFEIQPGEVTSLDVTLPR